MVKSESHIPKLRFKGFSDIWNIKQLGKITTRVTRKNTDLESDLPLTISAQYGLVDQKTYFDRQIASRDISGYFLIKKGEFAYNKSYSNGYPLGAIKRLDKYHSGVLSTLYIIFKPNEKLICSNYLASYYDTNYWYKEVSMYAAEGARNHGLLNIAPSDFFKTRLNYPIDVKEQNKIGNFFQKIDQIIELQQKSLDTTRDYKKSMLQKMFPQKGEKVPQIRFGGFSGDWGSTLLDSCITFSKGKGYSKSDLVVKGTPVVLYGSLYTNFKINISVVNTFVADNNNSIYSIGNEVIIPSSGETAIDIARASAVTGKGIILGGDLNILRPNSTIESVFLALTLSYSYINKCLVQRAKGNSVVHLYNHDIKELKILIPAFEEQQKIGAFFQKLDQQIEQQEKKLESYQNLKKAMLQRMFV